MPVIGEGYREFKLDNGLVVALKNTSNKTVAGTLRINHGALHERPGEEGLAHFLEHVLFTGGSKKYSPEEADEIKDLFSYCDAYTYDEKTEFDGDMLPEYTEAFLDFVSDIAFNPRMDPVKINEERERVIREIGDRKCEPAFLDIQEYYKILFSNGPRARFRMGKEEIVSSSKREDLMDFHSRGYHANNMALVMAGYLPENIEYLIRKHFEDKPTGNGRPFVFPPVAQLHGPAVIHKKAPDLLHPEDPENSSTRFRLGIIAPEYASQDSEIFYILSCILVDGQSSRIFKRLSQQMGLCYSVNGHYYYTPDYGEFRVDGKVSSVAQEEAIDAVFDEFRKIQDRPIEVKELEKIKRDTKHGILKSNANYNNIVSVINYKLETGVDPDETIRRLYSVTTESVREVANRYLPRRRGDGKYVLLIRDPLKKD